MSSPLCTAPAWLKYLSLPALTRLPGFMRPSAFLALGICLLAAECTTQTPTAEPMPTEFRIWATPLLGKTAMLSLTLTDGSSTGLTDCTAAKPCEMDKVEGQEGKAYYSRVVTLMGGQTTFKVHATELNKEKCELAYRRDQAPVKTEGLEFVPIRLETWTPGPKCQLTVKSRLVGGQMTPQHFDVEPKEACNLQANVDKSLSCYVNQGTFVTLIPKPLAPLAFLDWSAPCRGKTRCSFTCDAPQEDLTATFELPASCLPDGGWCAEFALPGIRAMWGPTVDNYWVAGANGFLLRLENSRVVEVSAAAKGRTLRALWGRNENDIWAVGEEGTVLHKGAGQTDWTADDSAAMALGPEKYSLNAVTGSTTGEVWIVGDHGRVLHRPAGQTSWLPLSASYPVDLHAAVLSDKGPSGLIVAGTAGQIFEYDRGWHETELGLTKLKSDLHALAFTGSVLWVAGENDQGSNLWPLVRGAKAGSWIAQSPPNDKYACGSDKTAMQAVWSNTDGEVWAVGDNGTICQVDSARKVTLAPQPPTGRQRTLWSIWKDAKALRVGGDDGIFFSLTAGSQKLLGDTASASWNRVEP